MNRTAILVVGLLLFGAGAAYWCVPRHVAHIQSDVLTRSTQALRDGGVRAAAAIDGQIVTLTGEVASESERARAQALVEDLPGVTRVVNALTVAAAARVAAGSAYQFAATLRNDAVELTGQVEDDTQRASTVGHARLAFSPRRVVDHLSLREGVPDNYPDIVKLGIEQLARLRSGRFTLDGERAALSGEAPDPTVRDSVDAAMSAVALAPYSAETSLRLAPPSPARREQCQVQFDRLLRGQVVRFATGSAKISADSYPLLDRMAGAAKACADVHVEVQGHTDAQGEANANLALSERRAAAVVDYLVREGVELAQLRARGYGETLPRQPNDTPSGRAANRRIELKARMPDEDSDP